MLFQDLFYQFNTFNSEQAYFKHKLTNFHIYNTIISSTYVAGWMLNIFVILWTIQYGNPPSGLCFGFILAGRELYFYYVPVFLSLLFKFTLEALSTYNS